MRAIVVGAGAVGQVLGYHLKLGGAQVEFLVKPRYAEQVQRGLTLYPLNQRDPWRARRLEGCGVVTDPAQVEAADYVVLCVSSTALRSGDWLRELSAAAPRAVIVTLQPGIEDRAFILEQLQGPAQAESLVSGLINFMSFAAQEDGQGAALAAPGVAYWRPPLTKMPFSGPAAHVQAIVACLRRGRFPSRSHPDVRAQLAVTAPALQMQVIALECAGWSFAELSRQRELRRLAFEATREAIRINTAHLQTRPPAWLRLLRPWMLSLTLALTRWVAPLDVERFFAYHFTKVSDQTHHQLQTLLDLAARHQLPAAAVRELRDRLRTGCAGGSAGLNTE